MKNLRIYSISMEKSYKIKPIESISKEMNHTSKEQQNVFRDLLLKEIENKRNQEKFKLK